MSIIPVTLQALLLGAFLAFFLATISLFLFCCVFPFASKHFTGSAERETLVFLAVMACPGSEALVKGVSLKSGHCSKSSQQHYFKIGVPRMGGLRDGVFEQIGGYLRKKTFLPFSGLPRFWQKRGEKGRSRPSSRKGGQTPLKLPFVAHPIATAQFKIISGIFSGIQSHFLGI